MTPRTCTAAAAAAVVVAAAHAVATAWAAVAAGSSAAVYVAGWTLLLPVPAAIVACLHRRELTVERDARDLAAANARENL